MKFLAPLHFLLQRCWSQGLSLVLWSILHHHHSPSSLSYTYNVQSPWCTKLACISCNIKKDEQKFSTLPYCQWFWGQLSSSRLLWCCSHSGAAELRQTSYEVRVPVGSLTAATELWWHWIGGVPPMSTRTAAKPWAAWKRFFFQPAAKLSVCCRSWVCVIFSMFFVHAGN